MLEGPCLPTKGTLRSGARTTANHASVMWLMGRSGCSSQNPTPRSQRPTQTSTVGVGLPEVRFHVLRHTCATLLLAQGVAARVVMETSLGHSQISLTLDM